MWEIDIWFDIATAAVLHVPVIFRASAIAIAFVAMWAVNVYVFDRVGVPFRRVLGLTPASTRPYTIFAGVVMLSLVLVISYGLYELCKYAEFGFGQAVTQVLFWAIFMGMALFSQNVLFRDFRGFMMDRFRTFFSGRRVEFVDVLTADALTSMSKLLADMQVVICGVVAIVFASSAGYCLHSIVGPVLASLPYLVRAIQCSRAYRDTKQLHHLINLGKYVSSFPVIWTSALKHQLSPVEGIAMDQHDRLLQITWLYAVTINTVYSFLWDVLMDWGLCRSKTAKYPLLRDVMLFPYPPLYYLAIVGDLALRLCWSLKLSSHIQRHATGVAFVFLFEILEVFRRFVWNFFRVEWQCLQTGVASADENGRCIPLEPVQQHKA